MDLLTDPAVWASFATLVVLEVVLGVDNVIFISIVSNRLPEAERAKARRIGLLGALGLRIVLLASIAWIVSLSQPIVEAAGFGLSWRDIILIAGGLFLIYKAATEIHAEVEGEEHHESGGAVAAGMASVIGQIMLLDLVFSIDSVITAVGVADHLEVMIAAVVLAVAVMMLAAGPIAEFVSRHPSTKMLALAFLVMIGMALVADGFHFHVERGFIYAAMVFGGFVELLNLVRGQRRKKPRLPA
ncbi:TerC family transporter protein [Stappia sp. 22II-S9-Z10]|nr:TerC family transporter protein [Stappia sp. 22II-S9-Z10]